MVKLWSKPFGRAITMIERYNLFQDTEHGTNQRVPNEK